MLFPSVVKWLMALLYDTSTGVTLASRGNSAFKKFQALGVMSLQDSSPCSTLRVLGDIIAKTPPLCTIFYRCTYTNQFQQFTSNPPLSSFKKNIMSTPILLCNLHTMSLAKAAPEGLKDRKGKRITLCPQERLSLRDGVFPQG